MYCALADQKFDYGPHQIAFWAEQILVDYPKMSADRFKKIIMKGIRGTWDDKFKSHTTFSVVINWIKKFNEEEPIEWDAKFLADCRDAEKDKDCQGMVGAYYDKYPQEQEFLNYLVIKKRINSRYANQ